MEKFDREGTSKLKSTVEDELGDVLDRFDALTRMIVLIQHSVEKTAEWKGA